MRISGGSIECISWWRALLGGILAALTITPALAHHSFAMYDRQTIRTLTGKLTRLIPGANHAQVYFELLDANGAVVTDASGKPVVWGAETGPAATLAKQGVTAESFPQGTIITVHVYPLRDGRTFGVLAAENEFIVRCGSTLPKGGCTNDTGQVFGNLRN